MKFGFQYLNSCLNTESRLPNSRFVLRVVNFIETRRATQRCSFCVPTMLNLLGSKFEQDEECCAALYTSTRKQQRQSIVQILVGSSGLEPPTSRLSGVRSNHLSYAPIMLYITALKLFVFLRPLVEMRRIELLTPCLQSRCSPS